MSGLGVELGRAGRGGEGVGGGRRGEDLFAGGDEVVRLGFCGDVVYGGSERVWWGGGAVGMVWVRGGGGLVGPTC